MLQDVIIGLGFIVKVVSSAWFLLFVPILMWWWQAVVSSKSVISCPVMPSILSLLPPSVGLYLHCNHPLIVLIAVVLYAMTDAVSQGKVSFPGGDPSLCQRGSPDTSPHRLTRSTPHTFQRADNSSSYTQLPISQCFIDHGYGQTRVDPGTDWYKHLRPAVTLSRALTVAAGREMSGSNYWCSPETSQSSFHSSHRPDLLSLFLC